MSRAASRRRRASWPPGRGDAHAGDARAGATLVTLILSACRGRLDLLEQLGGVVELPSSASSASSSPSSASIGRGRRDDATTARPWPSTDPAVPRAPPPPRTGVTSSAAAASSGTRTRRTPAHGERALPPPRGRALPPAALLLLSAPSSGVAGRPPLGVPASERSRRAAAAQVGVHRARAGAAKARTRRQAPQWRSATRREDEY